MEDNGRRYNSEVFGEEGALALTVLCMAVAVRAMGLKVLIVQKEDERCILMFYLIFECLHLYGSTALSPTSPTSPT